VYFYSRDNSFEFSIRQVEELLSRAKRMKTEAVQEFFKTLQVVLNEDNLLNKPQSIFNVDESGVQVINKPAKSEQRK
jgi:hypothetical protein